MTEASSRNDAVEPAEMVNVARRIRRRIVKMSHDGRAAHLASSLSCVDILVALYWNVLRIDPKRPDDPNRDRCILSKGHAAAALYAVLAERGFFDPRLLDEYARPGSRLPEQMSPGCLPGIEAATGSLGHGLPLGVGLAWSARLQGLPSRVFVVLSDGECNEGSVWEAALSAATQKLDHLYVVIDRNGWQATGRTEDILALEPLEEKWRAFGWRSTSVDGHDIAALTDALQHQPDGEQRPTAVIARTVKGKGVSFMEDDNNWHYRIPNDEELAAALAELADRPAQQIGSTEPC